MSGKTNSKGKRANENIEFQTDFFAYLDNPLKIKSDFEAIVFFNSLSQSKKNAWLLCLLLALARGYIG